MARVKRAVNAHKKRRTTLELASGYRGQRSRLYRKAKEQVLHSLNYAYRDRRARKGDFRQLWITRINAAARANGMTYNRFVQGLKAAGVEVDRKVLADIAVTDEAAFAALVEVAKANLPAKESAATPRGIGSLTTQVEPPRTERSARVVAARKLLRRAGRDRAGRFLVEGAQAVREAQRHGRVRELFVTEAAAARHPDLLGAAPASGSPSAPRRASPTPSPRRASSPSATCSTCRSTRALAGAPQLVAVCVGVADPGNAGTVVRVADAAGADAVVLAGDTVDPHNGKAVRASTGSLFHLPIARERDTAAALGACRAAGLTTLVADAHGELDLHDPARRAAARRARGLDIRWRGARRSGDRCRASRPPRAGADPRPGREPEPRHGRRGMPLRERRSPAHTITA